MYERFFNKKQSFAVRPVLYLSQHLSKTMLHSSLLVHLLIALSIFSLLHFYFFLSGVLAYYNAHSKAWSFPFWEPKYLLGPIHGPILFPPLGIGVYVIYLQLIYRLSQNDCSIFDQLQKITIQQSGSMLRQPCPVPEALN